MWYTIYKDADFRIPIFEELKMNPDEDSFFVEFMRRHATEMNRRMEIERTDEPLCVVRDDGVVYKVGNNGMLRSWEDSNITVDAESNQNEGTSYTHPYTVSAIDAPDDNSPRWIGTNHQALSQMEMYSESIRMLNDMNESDNRNNWARTYTHGRVEPLDPPSTAIRHGAALHEAIERESTSDILDSVTRGNEEVRRNSVIDRDIPHRMWGEESEEVDNIEYDPEVNRKDVLDMLKICKGNLND